MKLLLAGFFILMISSFIPLFSGKRSRIAALAVAAGTFCCLLLSAGVCIDSLFTGNTFDVSYRMRIPFASFALGIDPLSAFFLLPLLMLSTLCAVYGVSYMEKKNSEASSGASWFFFGILVLGMSLVVVARNGMLFLIAWEVMTLASFFLVTHDNQKKSVRKAGWIYLVASHIGAAFIFATFAMLGRHSDTLDFATFQTITTGSTISTALFISALLGFGSKAGFIPLHIWLPEAHPAAPSHVSSLMSGIMIKLGIYGFLRTLTFLGDPPLWWGITLIIIGASSGILGILFALAQQDIKRLLAYSSVENVGIIALGIGMGLVGISCGEPVVAVLGFAGALLHVINHCIFKGLLFLGAGTVMHETGTGRIEELGGLVKKMPATGICFMTGSASICGLPPFNGFLGEFLIFLSALFGVTTSMIPLSFCSLVVIISLALIGGLATACFSKAVGIIFLGEPRSKCAEHARDPDKAMLVPMIILALLCLFIGLSGASAAMLTCTAVSEISGLSMAACTTGLKTAAYPLTAIAMLSSLLIILGGFLFTLRRSTPRGHIETQGPTWDCGYAKAVPRIQYTSSSFSQPLTQLFAFLLKTKTKLPDTSATFPEEKSFSTETPDIWQEYIFRPAVIFFNRLSAVAASTDTGRIHIYILYIIVTILILLMWNFFR
ncbi:MAG: proton-conducting transporter membrane subunit [Victivallales bacterium]